MTAVWATFLAMGAALLALGFVGMRWRGSTAPVFHTVGRYLLILGVATALFPVLLGSVGAKIWAVMYVAFVAVLTVLMTSAAVARARALRS